MEDERFGLKRRNKIILFIIMASITLVSIVGIWRSMTRPPEKITQILVQINYQDEWIGNLKCMNGSGTISVKGYGPETFTVNRPESLQNEVWIITVEVWKLDDSTNVLRIKIMRTDYTAFGKGYTVEEGSTAKPYGTTRGRIYLRGNQ